MTYGAQGRFWQHGSFTESADYARYCGLDEPDDDEAYRQDMALEREIDRAMEEANDGEV